LDESGDASFCLAHVEGMTEAVGRLGSNEFDAVLLDLSLPDSRGLDTIKCVAAAAPNLPIIVLTGLDDETLGMEALRQGAQDFLVKGRTDGRLLARAIRYAMERKHAEQQLKALNDTLEHRVAERAAMASHRAAQLQALAAELTRCEHRERRRLAQILHDHLQQLLYAARLSLGTLRHRDIEETLFDEIVGKIDALLDECIAESRALTVQLCPPVLHEAGLATALEWLGRNVEQTCGLTVEVEADPKAEPENEENRIFLFNAARELLFNVAKHAETDRARLSLAVLANDHICLAVSDDGIGFLPAAARLENTTDSRFGLFSIRERVEFLGGQLRLDAAVGRGTRVSILLPSRRARGSPAPGSSERPPSTSISMRGTK
jgi:signal transduction histidine kinase